MQYYTIYRSAPQFIVDVDTVRHLWKSLTDMHLRFYFDSLREAVTLKTYKITYFLLVGIIVSNNISDIHAGVLPF